MLIQFQVVGVFQHLDVFPLAARYPVIVALKRHVPILIRATLIGAVRRGEMRGEWNQVAAFVLEGLGGNQTRLPHGPVVHADRGPLVGLAIQILQAFEAASRQEVGLDGPETPFFPRFAIAVAQFVTAKAEPVTLGERDHLRDDQRQLQGNQ